MAFSANGNQPILPPLRSVLSSQRSNSTASFCYADQNVIPRLRTLSAPVRTPGSNSVQQATGFCPPNCSCQFTPQMQLPAPQNLAASVSQCWCCPPSASTTLQIHPPYFAPSNYGPVRTVKQEENGAIQGDRIGPLPFAFENFGNQQTLPLTWDYQTALARLPRQLPLSMPSSPTLTSPTTSEVSSTSLQFGGHGSISRAPKKVTAGKNPASDHERHQCTECSKTFSTRFNLRRHFRIHTGLKPYSCQHCGRSFGRTDHLTKHLQSVHKNTMAGKHKNRR